MIVEYIRYALVGKRPADLLEAYGRAAASLAAAPECLGYEVTQCTEDPASIIVRILWTSADGHLTGFRKGSHFPPFFVNVRPFVQDIVEMRHYEPTEITFVRDA